MPKNPRPLTLLLLSATLRAADPADDPSYGIEFTPDRLQSEALTIRDEARTFPALVTQVHPVATWDDCSLLWVKETNGRIQSFVVDAVYRYKTADGNSERITLKPDRFSRDYDIKYFRVRAPLLKNPPPLASDARPPFARELLYDRHRGRLFEIHWPSVECGGTAAVTESRRIFVLQTPEGQWKILGECAADSSYQWHSDFGFTSLSTSAKWTDGPNDPVRIFLTQSVVKEAPQTDGHWPTPFPTPELHTQIRGTMQDFHAKWSAETADLQKKETLDTLAQRLALWRSVDFNDLHNLQLAEDLWKQSLTQENPQLSAYLSKPLPRTMTITIPSAAPINDILVKQAGTQPSPAR